MDAIPPPIIPPIVGSILDALTLKHNLTAKEVRDLKVYAAVCVIFPT